MVAQIHAEHAHVIISVWSRFDVGCENLQQLKDVNGVLDPVYPNVWPKGEGQWYDAFSADARRVYWRQILGEAVQARVRRLVARRQRSRSWAATGARSATCATALGPAHGWPTRTR